MLNVGSKEKITKRVPFSFEIFRNKHTVYSDDVSFVWMRPSAETVLCSDERRGREFEFPKLYRHPSFKYPLPVRLAEPSSVPSPPSATIAAHGTSSSHALQGHFRAYISFLFHFTIFTYYANTSTQCIHPNSSRECCVRVRVTPLRRVYASRRFKCASTPYCCTTSACRSIIFFTFYLKSYRLAFHGRAPISSNTAVLVFRFSVSHPACKRLYDTLRFISEKKYEHSKRTLLREISRKRF